MILHIRNRFIIFYIFVMLVHDAICEQASNDTEFIVTDDMYTCSDLSQPWTRNLSTFSSCDFWSENTSGKIGPPKIPTGIDGVMRCYLHICSESSGLVLLTIHELSSFGRRICMGICSDCVLAENGSFIGGDKDVLCNDRRRKMPQVFSGRSVSLSFHIGKTGYPINFYASYKLSDYDTECGGTYNEPNGTIVSPEYPSVSRIQKTTSCIWDIQVPIGHRVQISFTEFIMDKTYMCPGGSYIQIRDGPLSMYTKEKRLCAVNPPQEAMTFNSNHVAVYLFHEHFVTMPKIAFHWNAIRIGCNESIHPSQEVIVSEGFPKRTNPDTFCFWNVTVNSGSAICVKLSVIQLWSEMVDLSCTHDYLEVKSQRPEDDFDFARMCSLFRPQPIVTEGNSLTLILKTSSFISNNKGIVVHLEPICRQTLKGFSGEIESMNYPQAPREEEVHCLWIIEGDSGTTITIDVLHYGSAIGSNPDPDDIDEFTLQISDCEGSCEDKSARKTVLSGFPGDIPRNSPYVVHGMSVAIEHVVSNYWRSYFRLKWRLEGCIHILEKSSGTINSLGYPDHYANNVACKWKILTQSGTRIRLEIVDWHFEKYIECKFDGLEVYNGPDSRFPLLTKMCGEGRAPVVLLSQFNSMWLEFYTDETNYFKGFNATYQQLDVKVVANFGGNISGPIGYVYSPRYPKQSGGLPDYTWTITVHPNHLVAIPHSDVPNTARRAFECTNSTLEWAGHMSLHLGNINCSKEEMFMRRGRFTFSGNAVQVRYLSFPRHLHQFKFGFFQACGARLMNLSGIIETPEYMTLLKEEFNCSWTIESPSSEHRNVVLLTKIEWTMMDKVCNDRYLHVYEGEDDKHPLWKDCCGRPPAPIVGNGHDLTLQIVGGDTFEFTALYFIITPECLNLLVNLHEYVIGPKEDDTIGDNSCSYSVNAGSNLTVHMMARYFIHQQEGSLCNQGYVTVHKYGFYGDKIREYCRENIQFDDSEVEQFWIIYLKLDITENGTVFDLNMDGDAVGTDNASTHGNNSGQPKTGKAKIALTNAVVVVVVALTGIVG